MNARYAILSFLLAAGCTSPPGIAPGPLSPAALGAASARWPETSPDALEHGRQLLVDKCNQCHGYPDLEKVDQARWPAIMDNMGKQARLSDAERELVLRFVLAERAGATSGSP